MLFTKRFTLSIAISIFRLLEVGLEGKEEFFIEFDSNAASTVYNCKA